MIRVDRSGCQGSSGPGLSFATRPEGPLARLATEVPRPRDPRYARAVQDTRRHSRKRLAVEIRTTDRVGVGELQFDSLDLSSNGAFLRSDVLYDEGEGLELVLKLPGRSILAPARICWVRRLDAEGDAGMGVEFIQLSAEDRRELEAVLAAVE